MALTNKLTKEFLLAIQEVEPILSTMSFKRNSIFEKGSAHFVEFRKYNNTTAEFILGPSDWNIEIIISTYKGKFTLKDLFEINPIRNWINVNRYKQGSSRNLKDELLWYIDLLKVTLPIIE